MMILVFNVIQKLKTEDMAVSDEFRFECSLYLFYVRKIMTFNLQNSLITIITS